jgi:hypothetical protein
MNEAGSWGGGDSRSQTPERRVGAAETHPFPLIPAQVGEPKKPTPNPAHPREGGDPGFFVFRSLGRRGEDQADPDRRRVTCLSCG